MDDPNQNQTPPAGGPNDQGGQTPGWAPPPATDEPVAPAEPPAQPEPTHEPEPVPPTPVPGEETPPATGTDTDQGGGTV